MLKRIVRILLIVIGVFLTIFMVFLHTFDLDMDVQEAEEYFSGSFMKPTFHTEEILGKNIFYGEIGHDTLPLVVFVHGSPGSWSAFKEYMVDSIMQCNTHMISIDRPGFGRSEKGYPEESLATHAQILKPLIEKYKQAGLPVILAGHSYGGPVIARFAMDFPDLVDGIVIIAGSIDPSQEKMMWVQYPLQSPFLRWIIPSDLDVSNREILPLKKELDAMMPMWDKIDAEVVVVQGDKDRLVPAENANFAYKMLPQTPVEIRRYTEENHFVIWNDIPGIRNTILGLIECFQQEGLNCN